MANDPPIELTADEVRDYIVDMIEQLAAMARSVGDAAVADELMRTRAELIRRTKSA